MRRGAALAGLLLLAACGRSVTVGDQPDADADQRTKTAAKTLADLTAADKAARAPMPRFAPVQVERPAEPEPPVDDAPELPDTVNTGE